MTKSTKITYRSKFEQSLAKGPLKGVPYEPIIIKYGVVIQENRKYTPDFVFKKGFMIYLIEAKGRFRTADEVQKYLFVRDSLPENMKLVFLFMNPETKMPGAKIRKNGTYRTMAEWADTEGFTFYTKETIPDLVGS